MTEEQKQIQFERMEMICKTLEKYSEKWPLYMPEFQASNLINETLVKSASLSEKDVEKIIGILNDIKSKEHEDGIQWLDYKMHVNSLIKHYGFDVNIF